MLPKSKKDNPDLSQQFYTEKFITSARQKEQNLLH